MTSYDCLDDEKFIKDKQRRLVTFCRKKKELVKRAIELSKLCGQKIMLVVYDQQKMRMTKY